MRQLPDQDELLLRDALGVAGRLANDGKTELACILMAGTERVIALGRVKSAS